MALNESGLSLFDDNDYNYGSYGEDTASFKPYTSPFSGDWQFNNTNSYTGLGGNYFDTNTINPSNTPMWDNTSFSSAYDDSWFNNDSLNKTSFSAPSWGQSGFGGGEALTSSRSPLDDLSPGIEKLINSVINNPDKWVGSMAKLFAGAEERDANRNRAADLRSLMKSKMLDPAAQMREAAITNTDTMLNNPMADPAMRALADASNARLSRVYAAKGLRGNPIQKEMAWQELMNKNVNDRLNWASRMYSAPQPGVLAGLGEKAAQYANVGNAPLWSALASGATTLNAPSVAEQRVQLAKLAEAAGFDPNVVLKG